MHQDRNLEQLEKRLRDLAAKERSLGVTLRNLRDERKRDIERIDRMFDGKESHIQHEIDHILHEIPNLERDIERRREELEKDHAAALKK